MNFVYFLVLFLRPVNDLGEKLEILPKSIILNQNLGFKKIVKNQKHLLFLQKSYNMVQGYMILPENAEQNRALEAFLKAFKIKYVSTKPTLAELEARLLPGQNKVWQNLKTALFEAENNLSAASSLDELLTQYDNENHTNTPVL